MTKYGQLKLAFGIFAVILAVIGGGIWLASCEDDADGSCLEYKVWMQNQPILTGRMIQVVPIQHRECIRYK
jgi:hypothetical protein